MLEEAVKLDPKYAVAYAQLGWAYTWLGLFRTPARRGSIGAREALAHADAMDPNLAESHVVRHLLLWSAFEDYQILPAFEELRTAQRINPNVGHLELGTFYAHVGLVDAAMRELQRALEIDPTNASIQAEIPMPTGTTPDTTRPSRRIKSSSGPCRGITSIISVLAGRRRRAE